MEERPTTEARLRRLNAVLRAIRNVNHMIVRVNDPRRLIELACDNLTETLGYYTAWIALLDRQGTVTGTATRGFGDEFIALRQELDQGRFPLCMQAVLEREERIVIRDPATDCPDCPLAGVYAGRLVMACRLACAGRLHGVLVVSIPECFAHEQEEHDLLAELADDLGFALHRMAASEQLKLQEMILGEIRDLVTLTDLDGRILYTNQAACDLLGRRLEELLGQSVDIYGQDPARGATHQEIIERTLRDGEWRGEVVNRTKDGTEIIQDCRTWVLPDVTGAPNYLCGIARDITERKRAEQALRRREAFIHTVMDNLPIGIAVNSLDPGVRFEYLNDNFLRFYRTTREALAGPDGFWEAVYEDPAFREEIRNKVMEDCASGVPERMCWRDVPITRRGEETTFITARNTLIPDSQLVISTVWDVTDRKRAEQGLRESEARLRMTLMSVGDAVIATDAEGKITVMNPVAEALTGWCQADAAGRPLDEVFRIFNEDTRQPVENPVQRVLREGTIVALANHTLLIARDGTERPIADSGAPIHDGAGAVIGVVLVFRDQTAERAAELALTRSRAELKAIYDHAPVMICVADGERRVRYANPAFMAFTGISEEELKTGLVGDVFGCISALENPHGCGFGVDCRNCALRLALEDTLQTGRSHHNVEYRTTLVRNGERTEVALLGSSALVHAADRPHLLLCMHDITELDRAQQMQRQLEAQLQHTQKLESLGVMAGGIAHDFNNFLTVIRGNADLLAESQALDEDQREAVGHIRSAADHATMITRALQAFSRPACTETRAMDANVLVQETYSLLRRLIPATINFQTDCDPSAQVVLADASQLHQVLINLCVNARDAMPTGGRLDLETRRVPHAHLPPRPGRNPNVDQYVRIRVRDTGCGMDEHTLAHAFDPFFTTKPKDMGTGLGLAIVYRIVENHGGFLDVASKPGEGTQFDLYLPATDTPCEAEQPVALSPPRGEGRILIVDDEEMIASLLKTLLEVRGYEAVAVTAPQEAIALARRPGSPFDLAIIDYNLPHMTGQQCLEEIRRSQPDLRAILISGQGLDASLAQQTGVSVLYKPFTAHMIAEAVRSRLACA